MQGFYVAVDKRNEIYKGDHTALLRTFPFRPALRPIVVTQLVIMWDGDVTNLNPK